jgi:hypothetical protein
MFQGTPNIYLILLIVILFIHPTLTQTKLKRPEAKIAPVPPFSFLVEGNLMSVANTVRLEQMDTLLGIDFSLERWKETLTLYDAIFTSFSLFPFFSDEALKKEYEGMCAIGTNLFKEFKALMTEAFQFKNENNIDTPVNVCSETPIEITLEELKREVKNLGVRLNAIKETWTAQYIKDNVEAQLTLVDYCMYLNDLGMVYAKRASDILAAVEEMSDGQYPEVLFGSLIKNCTYSQNGEGERYKIVACKGTNKGLRCQIEIYQATNLRTYLRNYPVHYESVSLMGEYDTDLFGRTIDVKELRYLECTDIYGDFNVCMEKPVPEYCKRALDMNEVPTIIKFCNFTKSEPPIGTVLPNGGILIQGDDEVEILDGTTKIPNRLPIVIYTPNVLTIKLHEEDYIFTPAIQVESLVIVESILTNQDIENLISTANWRKIIDEIELENYVDLGLIILQIIVIPITIVGLVIALKQRKILKKLNIKGLTRHKGRQNLRENQTFLMKRVGK